MSQEEEENIEDILKTGYRCSLFVIAIRCKKLKTGYRCSVFGVRLQLGVRCSVIGYRKKLQRFALRCSVLGFRLSQGNRFKLLSFCFYEKRTPITDHLPLRTANNYHRTPNTELSPITDNRTPAFLFQKHYTHYNQRHAAGLCESKFFT